jgi:Protein of unknown function (DUF3181)
MDYAFVGAWKLVNFQRKRYQKIMSKSEIIEQLAAAIAEEIYIDVAKWHLYLNDAHLHIPLAESFYSMICELQSINQSDIIKVLTNTNVPIGGGKKAIPLIDLIPNQLQSRLLDIIEEFSGQSKEKY